MKGFPLGDLVRWSEVCIPRDKDGLGLRMAKEVYSAFLEKVAWQVLTHTDKLWVQALCEKYVRNENLSRYQFGAMLCGVGEASQKGEPSLTTGLNGWLVMVGPLNFGMIGG